ncbi:MAG: hypothetical protein Q9218_005244 [Villophora microphyllina]
MSLWEEARDQFVLQLRNQSVDGKTIDQFLQDKTTPEDTKRSARALQTDSDWKYGQVEVSGKAIPAKWIARIMDNIERFVAIGDFAMKGAPETVGLAWFAIKQVLNALQNNYRLYAFFGSALSSITEMMVLIRTYDKLYDERKITRWNASDIVSELFSQIRNVYVAILDFSYSVKKHIKGGKLAKIGHAIKDMFGAELPEFQGKMEAIQILKLKILESSQAAFQKKTFDKLEGVSDDLSNLKGTLSFLSEAVQSSLQFSQDMRQMMDDISKSTRVKSHYDLALQDFDTNKKALNPWPDSLPALQVYSQRELDTCTWIFDVPEYVAWRDSPHSDLLCIQGKSGVGKSTIAAFIIQTLQSQLAENPEYSVQYVFCENKAGEDFDAGQGLARLEASLIYQLYELAVRGEADSVLLQKCNDVFRNPKQRKSDRAMGTSGKRTERDTRLKKDGSAPGLSEAYAGIAAALGKKVYLVIDAADTIAEAEQTELISDLQELCAQDEVTIRVLLLCRSTSRLGKESTIQSIPEVSVGAYNGHDVELVIKSGLETMPGWSSAEKNEAAQRVREKSGTNVRYAVQVAIPFLRQPFQRPLSNRLRYLPDNMNETYNQHTRQLAPNYQSLLKTALIWTLLADGVVTVSEIMDAYSGIYLVSNDTNDGYMSVDDAKLLVTQLREAGGPFLEIKDNGFNHIVTLQDPIGVWEYCFDSDGGTSNESTHEQEVCPRCTAELHSTRTLDFSEKDVQLTLAVTCLKHLNSRLFQQRFLPAALTPESPKESNGRSSTEQSSPPQDQPENKVGGQDPGASKALLDDKQSSETNMEQFGPDTEHGLVQDTSTPKTNNTETELDVDDDDSQDSEDRDLGGWAGNDGTQEDDDLDLQDGLFRYEIAHWYHHVRQAERLWPAEERIASKEWQTLLAELDHFCVSDTRAFEGWKQAYVPYYRESWKPLLFAACYGLTSLAELLLENGADIKELSPGGYTPLHIASEASSPLDILRLLLDKGADPNCEAGDESLTPFWEWVFYGADYDCVLEFLRLGASCLGLNSSGFNLIHYFAYTGSDIRVLDLLLNNPEDKENCVDLHHIAGDGESPLHKLLSRTEIPLDLLKAFVTRGADVNMEDQASERPLYEAAVYGETEAIREIIGKVSDIDDDNNRGRTALHAAAWGGHVDTVKVLLEHGADINKKDHHGRTPLFFACLGSMARLSASEAVAELLLDGMLQKGLNVEQINAVTKRGRTPLRDAAAHGFSKVVESLLNTINRDNKDTINRRDILHGRSALHCAALHGRADIVAMLIKHGADATLRDGIEGEGKTALELCHDKWVLLELPEYEATISHLINVVPGEAAANRALLATAAEYGSVPVLEKLLNARADLSKPDRYGWTPLILARQYRREEAVTFLSKRVASIGLQPNRWTYTYGDEHTTLADDGLRVLHPGERTLSLLADHPVPAGLSSYYFEIEILRPDNLRPEIERANGTSPQQLATPSPEIQPALENQQHPVIAVGFSTVDAKLLAFPGWPSPTAPNALSWAYHGDNGGFYTSYKRKVGTSISQAEPYGFGDTVGCGVDFGEGTIYFTKNGKRIDEWVFKEVRGRLFPVLGLSDDKVEIIANFGTNPGRPFRWSPDVLAEKTMA